jgi:hypothetical protein
MSMQERLTEFLKDSSDWERKSTSIQGVFLLKLPNSKAGTWKESIAIEIILLIHLQVSLQRKEA